MKIPTRATFVHSSPAGSYTTPCKVLIYGNVNCTVSYIDPYSQEKIVATMPFERFTFPKLKKKKVVKVTKTAKTKTAYMCAVDFDWELGEAMGGVRLYPSKEDCLANRACVEACGMVKVKVTLDKVILQPNFKKMVASSGKPKKA